MKLPLELRFKIYEYAVMADRPIRPVGAPSTSLGVGLLRANRQIYREAIPFFRRNNFRVSDTLKNFEPEKRDLVTKHVQEITFEWWGYAKKDTAT